jgi:methionyl aminopeptidase
MSIKTAKEFEKLKDVGGIVRKALDAMKAAVAAGVTTMELDQIGQQVLREHGADAAPRKVYRFPGAVCISVNDEAVHGIPGNRVLKDGDIVKLDLVAEKEGFFADAAITVPVGNVSRMAESLIRCAESAFDSALRVARTSYRVRDIGRAVEREVRRCGFKVMPDLCGHGVGRSIHEEPLVPNHYDPTRRTRLTEGLVIAIEPIITSGSGRSTLMADRWTIRTADRQLSAHYEHTVVITRGDPVLLTA